MSLLNESVLILNRYLLAIQVTNARNAITALTAGRAKVIDQSYAQYTWEEWVEITPTILEDEEEMEKYAGVLRSPSTKIVVPEVIVAVDCEFNDPAIKTIRYSRKNVYERDKNTCQYCGKKCHKKNLTLDHVIPKSKGGRSTWENVVACCLECNGEKKDRLLKELGWKLLKEPKKPRWKSHVGVPFKKAKKEYWDQFLI